MFHDASESDGACGDPCTTEPSAATPLKPAEAFDISTPQLVELCPMNTSQASGSITPLGIREGIHPVPDITVDSGAGASAAHKKTFAPCQVEPSRGSKAGQHFIDASGGKMPNIGQVKPELLLETGILGRFTFQAAEGIREDGPLLAVSEVNSKGNPTWFDGEKSFILAGGSPEVERIRSLIQDYESKVPLHLRNGVFKMKAWEADSVEGFRGQGKK